MRVCNGGGVEREEGRPRRKDKNFILFSLHIVSFMCYIMSPLDLSIIIRVTIPQLVSRISFFVIREEYPKRFNFYYGLALS